MPLQDSAYPYHDWNARIDEECYAPNAASRILDQGGRIRQIVNNYAHISYDFGPTLLAWLEQNDPDTYAGVIAADRESSMRFGGHGSAMAQAYSHMILPLANRRDKKTQILWGIADFRHRFGRDPEGMWLPETAVDNETLMLLRESGLRFTVLTPYQAARVRGPAPNDDWAEVGPEGIDPLQPYWASLPGSGTPLALFFYDGPTSRAVAFEGLLGSGERFARRLAGGFSSPQPEEPQLVHIATDGETYGHHHRFGDMALAYAVHVVKTQDLACLTNYGEYLSRFPPRLEVEIRENTSWSCIHGIERWRSDCGCQSQAHPEWNQAWRTPLRQALDELRDTVAPHFEAMGGELLRDPWQARDAYIDVILDRSPESVERFLQAHALPGRRSERVTILKLLELQRHAMLMYTSCGFFFDDISGIETVQILQYAARVMQLAQELFGLTLLPRFLDLLQDAKSNVQGQVDGRRVYETQVAPAMVDLPTVGAHYAATSLLHPQAEPTQIYCYSAERLHASRHTAGGSRLLLGQVRIRSRITEEGQDFTFAALHFGDHNLSIGVRPLRSEESYQDMARAVGTAFDRADLTEVLRLFGHYFKDASYAIKDLFRDEQRSILSDVISHATSEAEAMYRQVYEHHAPLMRFVADLRMPLPAAFVTGAAFVLNQGLRHAFDEDPPDLGRIAVLLSEAKLLKVTLDSGGLAYALSGALSRLALRLRSCPEDCDAMRRLTDLAAVGDALALELTLWKPQNICIELQDQLGPAMLARAEQGDEEARRWLTEFDALAMQLGVHPRS